MFIFTVLIYEIKHVILHFADATAGYASWPVPPYPPESKT